MTIKPQLLCASLLCWRLSLALSGAAVPGAVDPAFNPVVTDWVPAIAVQPDGRILLGGTFTSVNGQPRNYIARLHPDGTVESTATFNPGTGPDGSPDTLVVQADGKILMGGSITTVNDQPRNRIARLNADGTLESTATFNPGSGPNEQVAGSAIQSDGKILLAGFFTSVNGQPRNNIARLHADGTVESTATFNPGTGANGPVGSVAVQADGKILLAGSFTSVNGQPRSGIARLNPNGTLESIGTFNPGTGANGEVAGVAVQADGKILLVGHFTSVNGQPRNYVARLHPDGTVESTATFNPGTGANVFVHSVTVQTDGKILLGGYFTSVNGQPRNRIARLNADGTVESIATFDLGTGANDEIFGVAVQADGKILVGGLFTTVNGHPRTYIARLLNDPATQTLAVPDRAGVQWLRGGAGPEVEQVTFELSTDGGANWSMVGLAMRIAGGWELTGVSLPIGGSVRARGRTAGGYQNGSSGLVETVATFSIPFTVTNTLDSGPGSLRQVMLDANAASLPAVIHFNIPPGGAQTITPLSPLPDLTNSVTLDATTQPGFAGPPIIELNGASAGSSANGLTVTYDAIDTVIRGFVINRFSGHGVYLTPAEGIVLEGNYIGTDLSGTVALGNQGDGVYVWGGVLPFSRVGGTNLAARNVISGNLGYGVSATLCHLLGNFIGTDASGQNPLGNGKGGVFVRPLAIVGNGTLEGGNRIAYNGGNGIGFGLNFPNGSSFIGNSIYANAGLGIDLGTNGVTLNDVGDGDAGANGQQNFPVLTAATNSASNLVVLGTLNSGTNRPYRIDFYSNPDRDPSGYGEGKTHLGFTNVMTDGNANASFRAEFPPMAGEPWLTATATDTNGNTSEFSLSRLMVDVIPRLFVVVNTNDSGAGSLRQAILDLNPVSLFNVIHFNIPPGGAQTIAPLSPLPDITNSVTLDATTQPGFAGKPIIELNGASAGPGANGLTLLSGGRLVRGFVINRFSSNGVYVSSGGVNLIEGNYIGTDVSGTLARGNGAAGIYSFSPNTQIGGTNAGSRNVISGNGADGVFAAGRQQILGNFIGVDASGSNALGNARHGVFWTAGLGAAVGNGTAAGANVIAHNGGAGVAVSGSRCGILGNSIFANGSLGIDLGANGVTLNDVGDGDNGANFQQNFPVLAAATNDSTNLIVLGTLDSGTNRSYRLDFYSNSECDPSGYGEGRTHLGFTNVTTDAGGHASFRALFPPIAGEPYLTATASDVSTNTSEFSLCLLATGVPPAGVRLSIVCTGLVHTISWPAEAAAYQFECAAHLTAPIPWQPVTDGITYGPVSNSYAVTNTPAAPTRFYRLRLP